MTTEKVHKFELRGLGKAPFRCIGVEQCVGPIRTVLANGVVQEIGSPGQPMGCCDFCGTGIKDCYIIRSADGKEFVVGCDCVHKTGDAGLKKTMAPHLRKLAHDRDDKRIAAAREMLERSEKVRVRLAAQADPTSFRDGQYTRILLDRVTWLLTSGRAGRTGMIRAARYVEEAAQ